MGLRSTANENLILRKALTKIYLQAHQTYLKKKDLRFEICKFLIHVRFNTYFAKQKTCYFTLSVTLSSHVT